jgi:hypothetical protein
LAPIIFILNFKKFLALKVKTFVWMAYFASLSLGILGIFGLGPLSNLLFQNSFMHRIDMWKIAFRIFLDFPLVGVGMDSYSFWYRTYRDSNQTSRWGELTVSDASHNLFLDFATSGGLILVGISVLMLFVIGKSSVKLLKNVKGVEPITFSLVFSAGAFFLQAMVSINQIALAVWGYLLAGCVVGMTRSNSINSGLNVIQRVPGIERKYKYTTQVIVASLLSLALALPPFLKDLHFRKAINNQNAVELVDAVNTFPFTDEYYRLGATLLLQNDLFDLSASLAKRGLGFFPRSIELYRLLISNKSVSAVDKANFTQKIIEIDKNINQ